MTQMPLIAEDIWQALTDCVRAMGGAKSVGHRMRPEKDPVDAGRWLLDCLNADRNEKLSLEQVLWLLVEARKVGCHTGASYLMRTAGYAEPTPVEPESERAALQRSFIESVRLQQQMLERMAMLGGE